MSSKSKIDNRGRSALPALLVLSASVLGGCSDIYFDRRETIALSADDHLQANKVEQMVDPWPRYVGNRRIPADAERMGAAVQKTHRPSAGGAGGAGGAGAGIGGAGGVGGAGLGAGAGSGGWTATAQ